MVLDGLSIPVTKVSFIISPLVTISCGANIEFSVGDVLKKNVENNITTTIEKYVIHLPENNLFFMT
ncbi:hypothetical protein TUM1881_52060 (plasmid) [Escherichia coli]|nr:hypothetical protein TUM1881_52060 [Escherichia coli]